MNAATAGATVRELMSRLGHSSERAALIYQHTNDDRDRAIAQGLDGLIAASKKADLNDTDDGDDSPHPGVQSGT